MIDRAHVPLVRRFEPILYFHPDEVFYPADAKRYVERCALWKAEKPFDDKASWGGKNEHFPRHPAIEHGKVAALKSEVRSGDTFLADPAALAGENEELFLELAGWSAGSSRADLSSVDDSTPNRFANLVGDRGVEQRYYDAGALEDSFFWYHAEVFTPARIDEALQHRQGLDLATLEKKVPDSLLICYYLFFPGNLAQLEGCESTVIGPIFGAFGGEWACVTLLLTGGSDPEQAQPRYVGLTSRNVGKIMFLDEEQRVGMTVVDWDLVTKIGDHPRLFVANSTHGLYASPGARTVEPFTPDDPGLLNCGQGESLDEHAHEDSDGGRTAIAVLKFLSTVIPLVGGVLLAAEFSDLFPPFAVGPSAGPQQDQPPEEGEYGVVVRPPGLALPDGDGAQSLKSWSVPSDPGNPGVHSKQVDGRTYSFMVDRRETDPNLQQVWWPSDTVHHGYDGRWGPRVANDPQGRRAGMRFPDFALMFLQALARELSK